MKILCGVCYGNACDASYNNVFCRYYDEDDVAPMYTWFMMSDVFASFHPTLDTDESFSIGRNREQDKSF